MSKFCKRCGKPLGAGGRCPSCNPLLKKPIDPERAKFIPRKNGKSSKFVIWSLIILLFLSAITITLGVLVYTDTLNIPYINDIFVSMNLKDYPEEEIAEKYVLNEDNDSKLEEDLYEEDFLEEEEIPQEVIDEEKMDLYRVTPPDADKFYEENSSIISTQPAAQSDDMSSERSTMNNFEERGFVDIPIFTNYTWDGVYTEDIQIFDYSGNRHPLYYAYYISSDTTIWELYEINGELMALMSPFNENYSDKVPLLYSESGYMTCYDSTLHKFYTIAPHQSFAIVKQVDLITPELLDSLS